MNSITEFSGVGFSYGTRPEASASCGDRFGGSGASFIELTMSDMATPSYGAFLHGRFAC